MNKENPKIPLRINRILYKKPTIVVLLLLIFLIALPLRIQNIKLNGYISDDAWWHFRHIKHIQETGLRLNPDIYEFATLSRPMTYPPLFHYFLAYVYNFSRIFQKNLSLIDFTNYFNILEGLLYILIIYGLSLCFTEDPLFSLIGAVASAVSYGMVIRARAGELMPFALADLFALTGLILLIVILKNSNNKKAVLLCIIPGILFGLSVLTWNAAVLIYFPLIILVFLAFILSRPNLIKSAIKLFCFCFLPAAIIFLFWYLPLVLKYGFNPHSREMMPFIKIFSVAHRLMPLKSYVLASGIGLFFVPFVFFLSFFKRNFLNLLLIFWIALAVIAAFTGWRGYIAVFPILSNIAVSVGICWLARFFKKDFSLVPIFFISMFILVAVTGYHVSREKLRPLNPKNPFEIRSNEKSIKMLEFLKAKYPKAITIDHIFWSSEDESVGDLRMVIGQYLEYLPKGSNEAIEDVSRFYFSDEVTAYKICQKYNVDLVIARSQILEGGMFEMLFYPLIRHKSIQASGTMLLSMLNSQALKGFELVYIDREEPAAMPFAVVYKVKKE
jgi:hypothetical protein